MSHEEPRTWRATVALLSVPVLWLFLFFILPVLLVAAYSVGALHVLPTDPKVISFDRWSRFLVGDSIYLGLFWKSVRISLIVSIRSISLSMP